MTISQNQIKKYTLITAFFILWLIALNALSAEGYLISPENMNGTPFADRPDAIREEIQRAYPEPHKQPVEKEYHEMVEHTKVLDRDVLDEM